MSDEGIEAARLMDRWFGSDVWGQIISDADSGDPDSMELMQQVSDQLTSLVWHLNNKSNEARLSYEVEWFDKLCDDFGVA